jgi:chemotaxis signal transduction protein
MVMNESNQLLCVRLGNQEFALNIRAPREIRGWISSTPLPHAPSYIKGMINLRGSVIAIIDLAERLALPSAERDICRRRDRIWGLSTWPAVAATAKPLALVAGVSIDDAAGGRCADR